MKWWGWSETDGAMLKRDFHGVVIAHRGDAVWEADLDKACELDEKFIERERRERLNLYIENRNRETAALSSLSNTEPKA